MIACFVLRVAAAAFQGGGEFRQPSLTLTIYMIRQLLFNASNNLAENIGGHWTAIKNARIIRPNCFNITGDSPVINSQYQQASTS